MTILEVKNFYKADEKKYQILENKEFLFWYQEQIRLGYYPFIEFSEIQELIDYIAIWYEIKYPEHEFQFYDGIIDSNFPNVKPLSRNMNIEQFMYRLSNKQFGLLNGYYRASGYGVRPIYNENGDQIDFDNYLNLVVERKNKALFISRFFIEADYKTGQVYNTYSIEKFIQSKSITLDELWKILKEKYDEELELSELGQCVLNHQCDIEFRRRILQLSALKLIYSNHTTPERGYERAKRFINEFNKKLNLDLTCDEIHEIMSKNYDYKENFSKKKRLK